MIRHFWAGCRSGGLSHIAHMQPDGWAGLDVLHATNYGIKSWSWGECNGYALVLARYLLTTSVGEEAATADLMEQFVEEFVGQWGDCWHLTDANVIDWIERSLLWESSSLLANIREDA